MANPTAFSTVLSKAFSKPTLRKLLFLAPAIVVACVYSNTLDVPFIYDDLIYILQNPFIRDLSNFLDTSGTRYVAYLSFALNYAAGAYSPTGYHLVNTAVHAAVAMLVYALVTVLFKTPWSVEAAKTSAALPHRETALAAALLFAAHPVQTQAVTYIAQRFASLATLFYLLALVLYITARVRSEATRTDSRADSMTNSMTSTKDRLITTLAYSASFIAAVAAMKTKEIAFTLPFVAAMVEFTFFTGSKKSLAGRALCLAPLLATALIIPLSLFGPFGVGEGGGGIGGIAGKIRSMQIEELTLMSRKDYLLTQFSVITTYLRLLVLPVNQGLIYDYPVYTSITSPRPFLSFIFLCALFTGSAWWAARSHRRRSMAGLLAGGGVLWFFITLSVESSVVPIKDVIFEHRLYLPSIGIAVSAAVAIFTVLDMASTSLKVPRATLRWTIVVLITTALGAATILRNNMWADPLAFWQHEARRSPESHITHNSLGTVLSTLGNHESALREYLASLEIAPMQAKTRTNVAMTLEDLGRGAEAVTHYKMAIATGPSFAFDLHNKVGILLDGLGRKEEAAAHYRASFGLRSDFAVAYYNLANILSETDDKAEAARLYKKAIELAPRFVQAHTNLALLLVNTGRAEESIDHFRAALAEESPFTAAIHNFLADAFMRLDRYDEAIEEFKRSLEAGGDDAQVIRNLRAAEEIRSRSAADPADHLSSP